MKSLFGENFNIINKAMDASSIRQKLIAQNIANAETPNYKRKDISIESQFERMLSDEYLKLKTSRKKHIGNYPRNLDNIKPIVYTDKDTTITNDGNNVDIDRETAALASNLLHYQTLARVMDQSISRYNIVLRGVR